jgi:hypothetical protein
VEEGGRKYEEARESRKGGRREREAAEAAGREEGGSRAARAPPQRQDPISQPAALNLHAALII